MAFVRLRDVSHRFGRRAAISGVDFSLHKGGFAFIIGASGAGKTTFLRLMHGDYPVQQGHVVVAGRVLNAVGRRELTLFRREAAMMYQDYRLLPGRTVLDNVSLALEVRGGRFDRARARAGEAANALGLSHLLGARCEDLCGGESAKVAAARALVVNPRLILADEPAADLDHEAALGLLELFRRANDFGTAVIVATHDDLLPALVPGADVWELEAGRLRPVAVGPGGETYGEDVGDAVADPDNSANSGKPGNPGKPGAGRG